jgi:hypothetical protein
LHSTLPDSRGQLFFGSSRYAGIDVPVARARDLCAGRKSDSFELLQHPADHSEWLWDSEWPATPLDHAGIHPLLVSPSAGRA